MAALMELVQILGAVDEPLSLDEVRTHLRNPERTDNDAELMDLITTAREEAEHRLGRSLLTQTWEASLDTFPTGCLQLPYPPLQSVTSITYQDPAAAVQTLATTEYVVDTSGTFGVVRLAQDKSWPSINAVAGAIKIRFVTGWPSPDAVPALIRHWMKVQVTRLYQQRSPEVIGASVQTLAFAERLLDRYSTRLPV